MTATLGGCIGSMEDDLVEPQGPTDQAVGSHEGPGDSSSGTSDAQGPQDENPVPPSRYRSPPDEGSPEEESSPQRDPPEERTPAGWQYDVLPPTIMVSDSGINPYHVDYRFPQGFDATQEGYYPEEAILLDLTLDAGTIDEAIEADREVWENLEVGVLYAFNGTRIVGVNHLSPCPNSPLHDCSSVVFDDDGHGSAVASSAAGGRSGSCQECRIVMTYGTPREAVSWALQKTWIDALSLSRSDFDGIMTIANASIHWTESGRTWFHSAGNGATGSLNAANVFSERSIGDNVLVGSWYNGETSPLNTRIYDILGLGQKEGARIDHLTEYKSTAGTSISSPDVAGHYAWILWQVRQEVGDTTGFQNGILARLPSGVEVPARGPLADGELTARELEDVLRATAKPVPPVPGGPQGGPLSYLWAGYGLVDNESREDAVRVVLGEKEMPERVWEDWWHETLAHARGPFFTYALCLHHLPQHLDPVATADCLQEAHWEPEMPDAPPEP